MEAPYLRSVRTCLFARQRSPPGSTGGERTHRESTLATGPMRTCQIAGSIRRYKVHRKYCYDAHRLPCGKTAAERKARTSCLSGSETIRRSTTIAVQGISPFVITGEV